MAGIKIAHHHLVEHPCLVKHGRRRVDRLGRIAPKFIVLCHDKFSLDHVLKKLTMAASVQAAWPTIFPDSINSTECYRFQNNKRSVTILFVDDNVRKEMWWCPNEKHPVFAVLLM